MYVACDPGATCGWAALNAQGIYRSWQAADEDTWMVLENCWSMSSNGVRSPIIVEDFQYRHLPKVVLTPVEVIGVIKEWARQHQLDIKLQPPSLRKFFTNERLLEKGLYRGGQPHAMDAMRHLLYYLREFK